MKTNINNLLVVEDNPYIGEKIVNAVKKIEAVKNIHLSDSLENALSFLKKITFEVITLDLSLPDGNGVEVLKYLREENIENKVFVFSSSTELKKICLRYGAQAFFDKANDFDKFIETIESS